MEANNSIVIALLKHYQLTVNVILEYIGICDQIWEKPASTHTTARHTFHHQTIAVHVD